MNPPESTPAAEPARNETPAERLDRNWGELLQELRVAQTGIQILVGFMLAFPFQPRFADLDPLLVGVYLTALGAGIGSTALIVAPVAAHRLTFRGNVKDALVAVGNNLAKAGLALLGVTLALVVVVVFGSLLGVRVGLAAGGVAAVVFLVLWVVVPLALVRGHERDGDYR
ncbi:MAG TPA: sodium:proton antiporter [Propionibacterium sp.]|nr:sodium:proton antiporter [Propionibacterium sp.]